MSNELVSPKLSSGLTLTAPIYTQGGTLVSSGVSATEIGITGVYTASVPGGTPAGALLFWFENSGSAVSGVGSLEWDGAQEVTRAAVKTDTGNLAARLTSTRAGYLDLLNTGVTVTGDFSATMKTSIATAVSGIDIDGKTFQNANKLMFAVLTGKTAGAGTSSNVFYAPDGVTARVTTSFDANKDRSSVALTP